jgi:imidazolonepropionase-like amidohydrolase
VGSLEAGKKADISFWSLPNLESLSYHFGELRASAVMVNGTEVWRNPDATARY